MDVVNLAEKFSRFTDAWSPRIVGDVNDMHVKVVTLRGEFVWRHHDVEEDEHCPDEVHVVLLEPKGTQHRQRLEQPHHGRGGTAVGLPAFAPPTVHRDA